MNTIKERNIELKKFKVHFFDKHGTETRTLEVSANSENEAEEKGVEEADRLGWPKQFKLLEAEEIE